MTWTKEDMFEPSGCLTREAFEALVNHQLPAEAKVLADEHITSCPLCSDALEGFAYQTSDFNELMSRSDEDFADLMARVHSKSHNRRILLVTLSTAASILMFLGLFLMINKSQPKMQVTQKVSEDTTLRQKTVIEPNVLAEIPKTEKARKAQTQTETETETETETPPAASKNKAVRFTPPVVSDAKTSEVETKDELQPVAVAPLKVESGVAIEPVSDSEKSLEKEDNAVSMYNASKDKRTSASRSAELKAKDESAAPLRFVEQMPSFPGGSEAMMKFINEHLKYPSTAAEMGVSGKVTLQFLVEKSGKITDIKVVRGIGGGCDEEAVRVVKLMPDWTPGKQNGKPTAVYFTLPISFTLQNH